MATLALRVLRQFMIGVTASALVGAASAQPFNEYQVKAVFLFNFAQFVEWSSPQVKSPETPFNICVLGNDPFDKTLDETVRGESIGTQRFEVRRLRTVREALDCQILYVSESEAHQVRGIVEMLRGRSILTVSDAGEFARQGGMVQFQTDNKRIKLLINVEAARAANLTISSKLLRPATIVSSGGG